VLVLASSSEGRPNVVLEAMAAGVPVVAGDIDGVREMIGDNERGLLFPVGDVQRLSDCLQRLLRYPPLAEKLAHSARQWILDERLTWDHTVGQYVDLYRQAIEDHKQRNF